MNKCATSLIASLILFEAAALNAAPPCTRGASAENKRTYLENQFSGKGWNPCATHHSRYVIPLAQTRYQPDWTLFANAANAQPSRQTATGAPNKPQPNKRVQVFQNEPVITRSMYNEANRRAKNAAIWTGATATVLTFVGLGFKSTITGGGINYGLLLRAPRWAIATGIATYFIAKPYIRDHAIERQLNKK